MSDKKQKRVLGRGLDALLNNSGESPSINDLQRISNSFEISVDKIRVNPKQPRTNFDTNEIENLSQSIKDLGIIQPITVRKLDPENYEIISGERRFRASKKAGLKSIPCYIKGVDNETDILKMSLVENVQRAVNVALINEIKTLSDKMGVDIYETVKAAATKPFGFTPIAITFAPKDLNSSGPTLYPAPLAQSITILMPLRLKFFVKFFFKILM